MAATLVGTYHSTGDSLTHNVSLSGKAGLRDLFILFAVGGTPTLPTNWVEEGTYTEGAGAFMTKLWRLPANLNTAGVTSINIALNGSRSLAAVLWEDDLNSTVPAIYFSVSSVNGPTAATPALWGTGLHTFTTRDQVFAVYGFTNTGSDPTTWDLVGYDNGGAGANFAEFADSGLAAVTGWERIWVASKTSFAESNNGVTATANGTRPGAVAGFGGMVAYNQGPPLSPDPVLGVNPSAIDVTFELGGIVPADTTVNVTNQGGGGTVAWTATDNVAWLTLTPASGTAPSSFVVHVDTTGLVAGTHNGTIAVTSTGVSGSPKTIPVSLTVTPQPLTSASTDEVEFYRQIGGAWRRLALRPVGTTTPEAHGAKGDCKLLTDISMTTGLPDINSATANFKSTDVGKYFSIQGAGLLAQGSSLTAKIIAVSTPTKAIGDVNAASSVNNAVGTYGTDDTQSWKEALQALVTDGMANGSYAGKLLVPPKQYMIAAATTKGGATNGNSQIPIPYINSLDQKFVLSIQGPTDGSGFYHWRQKKPAASGATLRTCLLGQTLDATYGAPSVLGGPTTLTTEPDTTRAFSNMLVNVDGLTVIAPRFPSLTAVDLKQVGQANVGTLSVVADAIVGGAAGTNLTVPNNDLAMGLRMPSFQNNDNTNIFSYGCEGFYYGLSISDHTTAQRLALIYCDTAIWCNPGGGPEHGAYIGYVSCEACNTGIEVASSAGGKYPVFIGRLDIEVAGGGFTIKDDNDVLRGEIHYAHNASTAPSIKTKPSTTIPGAQNVRIVDDNRNRGVVPAGSRPAVPATGVTLYNPLFRDAEIFMSGGTITQVNVDGVNLGVRTQVGLPINKPITLTYTGTVTWEWVLR